MNLQLAVRNSRTISGFVLPGSSSRDWSYIHIYTVSLYITAHIFRALYSIGLYNGVKMQPCVSARCGFLTWSSFYFLYLFVFPQSCIITLKKNVVCIFGSMSAIVYTSPSKPHRRKAVSRYSCSFPAFSKSALSVTPASSKLRLGS